MNNNIRVMHIGLLIKLCIDRQTDRNKDRYIQEKGQHAHQSTYSATVKRQI